ncbi:uncharacterized protein CcaverHIS019_0103680 [Cutaneotrichosporon cavernicola]|uniref:Uncharacterized protein n=1 Tax=Cutaneotrichosporon cavernicola TaxID=279322 RepID=A0AA48L023_9TREE|nr:uncharacterized protein CcaverHIS019_0103680 [Cutaneotrichosporon cavernicola]BEI87650.1 hypothetical protein CcaverHIS019_0103680 [Cutaneotrichosporon cavernicola]BEI95422.1 hypothetical protein CcaverHIS631_0103710 [Cutaneotrichosporon cavernicola]
MTKVQSEALTRLWDQLGKCKSGFRISAKSVDESARPMTLFNRGIHLTCSRILLDGHRLSFQYTLRRIAWLRSQCRILRRRRRTPATFYHSLCTQPEHSRILPSTELSDLCTRTDGA